MRTAAPVADTRFGVPSLVQAGPVFPLAVQRRERVPLRHRLRHRTRRFCVVQCVTLPRHAGNRRGLAIRQIETSDRRSLVVQLPVELLPSLLRRAFLALLRRFRRQAALTGLIRVIESVYRQVLIRDVDRARYFVAACRILS